MEKSKVYFTDMRVGMGSNLLLKLQKLIRRAGIGNIDMNDKFVAIKIHFGEPGNLSYLRPNFAKAVADVVKEMGGKPFLTDCNTLYVGRRKNALDHLDAAYENGFTPFSTGCQILIGDGLTGNDEVWVPVKGGELVKEAKIGRAVMDADVFISLNHFKGHECTGFGGALKNIGMGCGSRAGKMEQHNGGKTAVDAELCVGCKFCAKQCAHDAISFESGKASVDQSKCVGCGRCIHACRAEAISQPGDSANDDLCKKIAEYSKAVVDGRPQFHINIVNQVSPYCDCHPENDAPIIPDVGMFASFDPVALDAACADACNAQPAMANSVLGENLIHAGETAHHGHIHTERDRFDATFPTTNWRVTLEHAEKIGVGTQAYELIQL
ncbi:MAG: DUF362 domain-containing protein [Clostridia bacterium]|nr:DUF362 domain-containing protein [Clostridia bacterium]